jgi:hypothetical protein
MNYYQRYIRQLKQGDAISPRGMSVRARYNQVFEFMPGTCWRREMDNPAIGFIEGMQFIAGIEDLKSIETVAPHVDLSLFGPTSFYGIRTVDQFDRVLEELASDKASRRGLVAVAHHDDVSETMPCTLSMVFFIRQDELHCTVNMRSSDAVWGLPYDMIQFGMVQTAMATVLQLGVGKCTVNIVNAHIYDDHQGSSKWTECEFDMPLFQTWGEYKEWARRVIFMRLTRREILEYFHVREK